MDLPQGSFIGTGVKTVVLFFEKGKPTDKIWYYQLDLGRNLGKTNPLIESDLIDFIEKYKTNELSKKSWLVDFGKINNKTFDLTVNNPNNIEEVDQRTPLEIIAEIKKLDIQSAMALEKIEKLL